jgi:hypothetical protein|uniref:Uncharacterized protein n=1 Tax=Leptospirillum ferriphilum TaxID=178606 RepID=A0A2I2MHJ0_9BACT
MDDGIALGKNPYVQKDAALPLLFRLNVGLFRQWEDR